MIVFPAVHIMNYAQAERQANIALSSGADGVFFIHHGILGDALTLRLAKDFNNNKKYSDHYGARCY